MYNHLVKRLYDIKNLCSSYGNKIILNDLSLEIPSGCLVSLIGPNGSGKTTLLRVLSGLKSYSGSVMLHGHEVRHISRRNFARMLSFVMSARYFSPSYPFTVREIISMGRMPFMNLFSRLTPDDTHIIMNSASLTGINHLLERNIMTLSDGERQLVLISCGLAQDTEIILLDEPANSLDPDKSARVYSMLRRFADNGKSIITSVHDVNISRSYSDYYIAVKEGRLISHGDIHELNEEILYELYGVRFKAYYDDEGNGLMWHALPE